MLQLDFNIRVHGNQDRATKIMGNNQNEGWYYNMSSPWAYIYGKKSTYFSPHFCEIMFFNSHRSSPGVVVGYTLK